MQILGLSDSTPKPENRIKSLFWPRVNYPEDVEYLGAQGYWICLLIAVSTLVIGVSRHQTTTTLPDVLCFYLAGVGIRQKSRFAATSVLSIYFLSVITAVWVMHSGSIVSFFFLALLLSNVRATWVAHRVVTEQPPISTDSPRGSSLMEKFTDILPRLIWPVGKWIYYVLAGLEFVGLAAMLIQGSALRPR